MMNLRTTSISQLYLVLEHTMRFHQVTQLYTILTTDGDLYLGPNTPCLQFLFLGMHDIKVGVQTDILAWDKVLVCTEIWFIMT